MQYHILPLLRCKKLLLLPLLMLLFLAGCTASDANNYLRPTDFASYLTRAGIKNEGVRPVPGDPFGASEACAIMVDGSEIGIYKFDQTVRLMRNRLDKIKESNCVYILGVKRPVVINGSFILFGQEKNPKKHEIVKVFENFR